MADELTETIDELENEVMTEIGLNPYRAYNLRFPYTIEFHLSADDKNTFIQIHTVSEEVTFAKSVKDALLQKERSDEVSKEAYINHILRWASKQIRDLDIDTCDLTYTDTPEVRKMTDDELEEYRREVISVA